MKALPFVEAIDKLDYNGHPMIYRNAVMMLRAFYSRPFTIDMLVNPIEQVPREIDPYNHERNRELAGIAQSKNKKWQESENKVLFELNFHPKEFLAGKLRTKELHLVNEGIIINETSQTVWISGKKFRPSTLNDFVSDCNRAELKLIWKQSIINKYFS